MWILATDVRDGQRLAFPQFSTIVSFDVQRYRERIDRDLQDQERQGRSKAELVHALKRMEQAQQEGPEDPLEQYQEQEQMDQLREQIDQLLGSGLRRLRDLASKLSTAEALLYVSDSQRPWPVRCVMQSTSWADVQSYTRSGAQLLGDDQDELPDPDRLTDWDEQP